MRDVPAEGAPDDGMNVFGQSVLPNPDKISEGQPYDKRDKRRLFVFRHAFPNGYNRPDLLTSFRRVVVA